MRLTEPSASLLYIFLLHTLTEFINFGTSAKLIQQNYIWGGNETKSTDTACREKGWGAKNLPPPPPPPHTPLQDFNKHFLKSG